MLPLLLALALAQPLLKWTDRKGGVHYTNDPASVPKGVKPVELKLGELEYLYTGEAPAIESTTSEELEKAKQLTHAARREKISEQRAAVRKALQELAELRRDVDALPAAQRTKCWPPPAQVPPDCKELLGRVTQGTMTALGATLPYAQLNLYEEADGLEKTPRPPAMRYLPDSLASSAKGACTGDRAKQKKELEAYLARRRADVAAPHGADDEGRFQADGAKFGVEVATDHLRNLAAEEKACRVTDAGRSP